MFGYTIATIECLYYCYRSDMSQKAMQDTTRALRAHTLRALHLHCIIVQLGHMLWTTFTYTHEASAHEQKVMHNA